MATQYRSEKDVKRVIKKIFTKHEWFYWMPPANAFGKSGISDFNALRAGVFMAVEAKFDGNKPTAQQVGYLQSISAEGGFGFVVDEKTIETFREFMEAFDRSVDNEKKGQRTSDEDGPLMLEAIRIMTEPLV